MIVTSRSPYDEWGARLFRAPWYRDPELMKVVFDRLRLTASDRVLDVGCGDGRVTLDMVAQARQALGVDSSSALITAAVARSTSIRASFVRGDFISLVPSLGTFDAVLCKNVLHLFDDLDAVLAGLKRVTRLSGRICIVETISPTPEANEFVRLLFRTAGLEQHKKHFFGKRDVRRLFQDGAFVELGSPIYFPQEIILGDWLKARGVSRERQGLCEELLRLASGKVKTDLAIRKLTRRNGRADWGLLRLEFISLYQIPIKN